LAHGFAGDRFFPATIVVDDPAVADELSLPTVQKFENGDGAQEIDVSTEWSKRITDHFGVSVGETWTHLKPGATGFQNLDTTFKYQLITDAKREFMFSAGVGIEWANTGAKGVGAEDFNTYTPQIFFGKGFGDLPEEFGMIRPFALTGQFGYALPGLGKTVTGSFENGAPVFEVEHHADVFNWGLTLQYSLPYLNSNVKAIEGSGSEFLKHLIPLVEASFTTPVANFDGRAPTTGTINPGVIWSGEYMQWGVEAVIPVNRDSGRGVGAIGQLHFYLDDIFPKGIGQPLFGEERP
jgi:hypothetical protein